MLWKNVHRSCPFGEVITICMRIGLNLLFLLPRIVGGTETYAVSLLRSLSKIDRDNDYLVFVNSNWLELELEVQYNFKIVNCPIPARIRGARYLWEQIVLPLQANKYRLDLLHSLGYVQPLYVSCPSVVTVHDVNFRNLASYLPPLKRELLRFFITHSAVRASHILTGSHFSKTELIKIVGVPEDKVTVAHYGVNEGWANILSFPELSKKYRIQKPYVFSLCSLSPHKNMRTLIEAFSYIKAAGFPELQLVVAGHPPRDKDSLDLVVKGRGLQNSVVFTGYVSDAVLSTLYVNAKLFVFPSLYEGFGIPVLEALAYGTPVASSNAAALPEIAGDAVSYFNPRNVEEMVEVIIGVLQDQALREKLIARGKERVKLFTWEECARRTLEVYERFEDNLG